ncbi:Helicase SWR1 [Termitomyces sp. J132]|nr:Helicase SWR1 [Termitomyces sp. J132]
MSANGIRSSKGQETKGCGFVTGGDRNKQGRPRGKAKQGGSQKVTVVQEVFEAEREDLISQKQKQLQTVVDRHDTLVREMFHMDHFINMVSFNPKEAKTDNSKVFQNYKTSLYNLVDKAAAGSSRSTRRSRTEQEQLLKTSSISAPFSTPASVPSRTKRQTRAGASTNATILQEAAKSSGLKERTAERLPERANASIFDDDPSPTEESISVIVVRRQPHNDDPVTSRPMKKRKLAENKGRESISVESRRSGRLRSYNEKATDADKPIELVQSSLPSPKLPSHPEHEPTSISAPPALPRLNIKRVKLLVRRPAPPITNPKQRPPPVEYNSSVDTFLRSYFTLNGHDVKESTLEHQVQVDVSVLERAERLQKNGGFLPIFNELFQFNEENMGKSLAPPRQSNDPWDHVVEAACHIGQSWRRKSSGQQIASQWAKAIRGYWDGQEAMKERLKIQEERRLRALAKATIRMVTDEWKKAVFHIREQERLKQEADEVRRGREHLDAILDQSGQLLETQQSDLTRGELPRSRSSSMSLACGVWGSDEEEEENEGDISSSEEEVQGEGIEERDDTNDEQDEAREDEALKSSVGSDIGEASSRVEDLEDSDAEDVQTRALLGTPRSITKILTSEIEEPHFPSVLDGIVTQPNANTLLSPNHSSPRIISDSLHRTDVSADEDNDSQIQSAVYSVAADLLENEQGSGEAFDDENTMNTEKEDETALPEYLKPFAVAPVNWSADARILPPLLLRGNLRPYQQSGLEWLASLHTNNLNGILADEMGLGKTIQTIALLAHLACDRGIWGPHLIIVPTSVLLNWEMELKKFLPGFRVLSYHGSQKRRKELRQGWNDKYHFNVCITSYTLASRDAHIFKRKAWYYLILDEAHMIKNFKSQRWNILLMFRSFRRLLLTGTPLQNNLTELWALLQFLMSGASFASLKDFGDWFSNPVEKAIEMGNADDDDTMQRVAKLHTVLRPYLLRRLKRDVEKELPSKYEHLVICPLSKRQRFLYDEFMTRAQTRDALQSGIYQKIANILMQLRKVCNHPDLFEVRSIVTSFAMERSALADFEIKELLLRRRLLQDPDECLNLRLLGLKFINDQGISLIAATTRHLLDATALLPFASESPGEPPPKDLRTIAGFRKYSAYMERARRIAHWSHIGYVNRLRCKPEPIYGSEELATVAKFYEPIFPNSSFEGCCPNWESPRVVNSMVKSYIERAEDMASIIEKFAFVTPAVVALDLPRFALPGYKAIIADLPITFDEVLHKVAVKLQIAFPDPLLLQYDCGKLQELSRLLREKKAGGHRILIFTQMTKILDILEIYLNFHGYLYLRLDGATKIEDRQYITERFNADPRIFCFIASSRSGGVGINLTGADTVVFYDSDFNPQMDKQCEDRAHRIGQIRDVHIYRFVSQHTVEEALLRKANQKRSLDDLVIQKGEFDWRSLFNDQSALSKALEEFEDTEDVRAAAVAATEEVAMQGADEADFEGEASEPLENQEVPEGPIPLSQSTSEIVPNEEFEAEGDPDAEGGSVADFMIAFVQKDYEFFKDWRL